MPPTGPAEHQFRENSRAPVAVPIRLQFDALEESQEGFTANLSIGGMFVRTKNPRPVGTLLRFELDLGEGEPIRGVGEIVWMRAHSLGPDAPSGFGIQFGHLDEANRGRLKVAVLEALESLGVEGLSEPAPERPIQRSSSPSPPIPRAEPAAPRRERRSSTARARAESKKATKKSRGAASRTAKKDKKGETPSQFEMSGRTKFLLVILVLLVLLFLFMT